MHQLLIPATDSVSPRNFGKTKLSVEKNLAFIDVALKSANITRFPLLRSAFVTIANIFEVSQKAQINKYGFLQLAEDSIILMVTISVTLLDQQEISQSMRDNMEELLKTLQSIQSFGETRVNVQPDMLLAICLEITDRHAVGKSMRELERCIRLFGFQSLLELQEKAVETIQLMEQCIKNGSFSVTTTNMDNRTEHIIPFDKTEQLAEPHIKTGSASNKTMNTDNATENTVVFENSQEDETSLTSHDRLGSVLEQFGLNTGGFRRRHFWTNE